MKRLIISNDGTWNTPEQEENNEPCPTNVYKLHGALAARDTDGNEQRAYYHTGVGTEGSLLAKTAGGVYGGGLDKNIKSSYAWLARNYEPGDLVYLFGFSRGAYSIRCLGELISHFGLPDFSDVKDAAEQWARIDAAYDKGYMAEEKTASKWRAKSWEWLSPNEVPIEFIGVWDTVGARGIPDDMALLNLLDDSDNWRFYDTRLGKYVKHARHALAADERRASFTPTLWTDEDNQPIYDDPEGRVKQLWFPGVHSDIGGGYSSCGLADGALKWMIDEAAETGLAFKAGILSQIKPDHRGVLHDSAKGVWKALRTRPRNLPDLDAGVGIHASLTARRSDPPITQAFYHPTKKLEVGESHTLPIYALEQWNNTGLYLAKGKYKFTATGEWMDKDVKCGPGGTNDGKFQAGEIAHVLSSVFGKLEGAFQLVTGNKKADFVSTKRIENIDWMCLVGVIANDGAKGETNPPADGSPAPHQQFEIGDSLKDFTVKKPGYFYAFANDAWHFYGNNRGSVTLTIKRTA